MQTLDSIQAQTWPHIEYVVIDGGSTDGTLQILNDRRDMISVLISEPDGGIYDALNKGFSRSTGDIIGIMHSDDFYAHERVLECVASAFDDPAVDVVYGDLDYVSKDEPSRIIRRWRPGSFSHKKLAWGWMPPHPTMYLRRRVIDEWGVFDTHFRIAADYDAILRYLSRGKIYPKYIPQVLVKMRVGGESNRSLSHILRKSQEDLLALRKNNVGGFRALAWKNLSKIGQFF